MCIVIICIQTYGEMDVKILTLEREVQQQIVNSSTSFLLKFNAKVVSNIWLWMNKDVITAFNLVRGS